MVENVEIIVLFFHISIINTPPYAKLLAAKLRDCLPTILTYSTSGWDQSPSQGEEAKRSELKACELLAMIPIPDCL